MPGYIRRPISTMEDVAINALGLITRKVAEVHRTSAANAAASTEYVTECPQREAGDKRPESERIQSTAIIGKVTHDHAGNETGLEGFGVAVQQPVGEAWRTAPSTAMQWIAPTLTHSWANAGATAGYMIDALGFVHIKGTVTGGELHQPIFTLPTGYIPSALAEYACSSSGAFAAVIVNSSGQVILAAGSNVDLSLAGVAPFLAER